MAELRPVALDVRDGPSRSQGSSSERIAHAIPCPKGGPVVAARRVHSRSKGLQAPGEEPEYRRQCAPTSTPTSASLPPPQEGQAVPGSG
eukprot:12381783-Alexandrium_andersonii.AAC.1